MPVKWWHGTVHNNQLYVSVRVSMVSVYLVTAPENILSMMRVEMAATTTHKRLTKTECWHSDILWQWRTLWPQNWKPYLFTCKVPKNLCIFEIYCLKKTSRGVQSIFFQNRIQLYIKQKGDFNMLLASFCILATWSFTFFTLFSFFFVKLSS